MSERCVTAENTNQRDRKIFVDALGLGVSASVMIIGKRIGVLLRVIKNAFQMLVLSVGSGSVECRIAPNKVKKEAEIRLIW